MKRKSKMKNNPKNENILSKIKIRKTGFQFDKTFFIKYYVTLFNNGENKIIAWAIIQPDENFVSKVEVEKEFRRFGIATVLYDHIENDLNVKLIPVKVGKAKGPDDLILYQDEDGKLFWKNRLK